MLALIIGTLCMGVTQPTPSTCPNDLRVLVECVEGCAVSLENLGSTNVYIQEVTLEYEKLGIVIQDEILYRTGQPVELQAGETLLLPTPSNIGATVRVTVVGHCGATTFAKVFLL